MRFIQAIKLIDDLAMRAGCDAVPDVRIIMATPSDQQLIEKCLDADARQLPLSERILWQCEVSRSAITCEINGLTVEISNKDRGTRAEASRTIKEARAVYDEVAHARTITPAQIATMRAALSQLLKLVKG